MPPNNPLTAWGNDKTMNLNTLLLTNIQSSPYFKVQLFELKTFHEVVDEIYYRVEHLEPWEKGSRRTAGQTGMCGGVRGVGAGGIVSSAYCLLFKLFTLKLTKKQLVNLITHRDSPYIRGLGFMYIRYCQAPADLWDWYEPYLDDDEELDVKAGGGHSITIGEMLRQWLVKLEWFSTLFPRIPVPIQKDLEIKFRSRPVTSQQDYSNDYNNGGYEPNHIPDEELSFGEAERAAHSVRGGRDKSGENKRRSRSPRRSPPRRRISPRASPSYNRSGGGDFSRELEQERERQRRERTGDSKQRSRSRERPSKRSRSRDRSRERGEHRGYRGDSRDKGEHRGYRSDSRDKGEHRGYQIDSRDKGEHRGYRVDSRDKGENRGYRSDSRDKGENRGHRSDKGENRGYRSDSRDKGEHRDRKKDKHRERKEVKKSHKHRDKDRDHRH